MNEAGRVKALSLALRVLGVVLVVGIYPLTVLWPSGWAWHEGQSFYLQMIIGIYATLGVFLFLAARNPLRHVALISFTIWSSFVHAAIMAVQSLADTRHIDHLYGDVPALLIIAALLAWLCPRAFTLGFFHDAA